MINLPLLLSNFGSAGGQSEDVVKVTWDVGVQGPRQVPRLADPVVVQSPKKKKWTLIKKTNSAITLASNSLFLSVLEVGDKLRELGLHVERGGKPPRLRDESSLLLGLSFRLSPTDDAEQVLDGEDVLEGELVDPLARVLLTELPKMQQIYFEAVTKPFTIMKRG